MSYVLLSENGRVLARSQSKSFLQRKQKRIRGDTRIQKERLPVEVGRTPIDERRRVRTVAAITQTRNRIGLQKLRKPKVGQKPKPRRRRLFDQENILDSSVIKYLDYDLERKIVHIQFIRYRHRRGGSNKGSYLGIPPQLFEDWWEGKASCRTDDTSSLKRWKKGDTPSLGAFFNQKIKGKFTYIAGVWM
jgi:hypothetical protein